MKISELRTKSKEEIDKTLRDSRKRLVELRFQMSGGRVKNVREIQHIRRDIARILTILAQK